MSVLRALTTGDILLSLLVMAQEAPGRRLNAVSREIHETVCDLKAQFPHLFEGFLFSTSTLFPYSEQLATSFQDLEWARLIGMENPDFRVFFVKQYAARVHKKTVEIKMDERTAEDLKKASEIFWAKLGQG